MESAAYSLIFEAIYLASGIVFNNLVNRHDAIRLTRKLGTGQIGCLAEKIHVRGSSRVVAHWSTQSDLPQQWWDVPAVVRRWNTFASGNPDISFPRLVADSWLADRTDLCALSLGCGTGHREIVWAKLGVFGSITGIDLAPDLIRQAIKQTKACELDPVLHFDVANFTEILQTEERYDVIFGLHSLHHFSHIDDTMRQIACMLKPGGLLIFDEFVGPKRFQWTRGQVSAANALLSTLPRQYRMQHDGRVKSRVIRPSLLSMRLKDPSEAVESNDLLPALRHWFNIVEELPYGGTILHIAFSGIAQNFLGDDPITGDVLQRCFDAEDEALPRLGHDFMYAVGSPKSHLVLD